MAVRAAVVGPVAERRAAVKLAESVVGAAAPVTDREDDVQLGGHGASRVYRHETERTSTNLVRLMKPRKEHNCN